MHCLHRARSVALLSAIITQVTAECGCGYTVNSTTASGGSYALFTDLLETDFLHLKTLADNASYSSGWLPQVYNESAAESEGPYVWGYHPQELQDSDANDFDHQGMSRQLTNLEPNPISTANDWTGPGIQGNNPGLQLWVRSSIAHITDLGAMVPCAELVTLRDDILYGSFRIAMQTTATNGTCAAFFFYRNNTQEIDVEILSAQQTAAVDPVNLIVQNTSHLASNDNSSSRFVYDVTAGSGGGTDGNYNEYRFDWLPDRIDYYVNGQLVWTLTENVPSAAGRIHLSHWSNGNRYWSMGPPTSDAALTVSYVKAYFNSTNSTRQQEYASSVCGTGNVAQALAQTCQIPDQTAPPNPFGADGNSTGKTFFFTLQNNMTENQTVYGPVKTAGARKTSGGEWWSGWLVAVIFALLAIRAL